MRPILGGTAIAALLALAVPAGAAQGGGDIPPSPSVDANSHPGKVAKPGTEAGVTATTEGVEKSGRKPKVAARDKSGVAAQRGTEAGPSPRHASADAAHVTRDEAKHAQTLLQAENLYHGGIDGVIGPQTKQALAQFQKQEGLKQTSALDPATMRALNQTRNSASGSSSAPPSGSGSGKSGK
jgi:peptidoglycan hydrolase-like protein with peptidoglycan-binding domain